MHTKRPLRSGLFYYEKLHISLMTTRRPASILLLDMNESLQITDQETNQEQDTAAKRPIRVLIVDDGRRPRAALRTLLLTIPAVKVIGEAEDGREAVEFVEKRRPDVVLMDVRMPRMNGLEATRVIKVRWPEVKVVILTLYANHRREALAAGADAFITKGDPPEHLLQVLSNVASS